MENESKFVVDEKMNRSENPEAVADEDSTESVGAFDEKAQIETENEETEEQPEQALEFLTGGERFIQD